MQNLLAIRRILVALGVTAALTGCASHGPRAAMTSGEIGCPTSEIQISEGDMGWTTNTWAAQCRGQTFYCTYTSGYNLGSRTQCRPALSKS